MKKIIGVFTVVLISLGIADLIQGVILTFIYTPNRYSTNGVEMANFLSYMISATTMTITLWIVFKQKNTLKGFKSTVKVS
ncbi:hypothetical protein A8F94_15835 [Bacillus sp. FJAT-27225]|uniref:hypothetical protein n=1 Tax=Bacillus sp. FJAT-27225 TaxID=1743144 RepID=UPI00080C2DD3|nr:hypothetical protein [Bacillus sp. FJAT-27225]OCA84188.1 hypothetical protein A8F94_15835 [Bacillus sp. FJAT-27225]